MDIITKLPTNAVQKCNLTCITDIHQKFYQIYLVEEPSPLKTKTYTIITSHGRIGHTPKHLKLASKLTEYNAISLINNTELAKKNKGYVNQVLHLDPIKLSTTLKIPSKTDQNKFKKPKAFKTTKQEKKHPLLKLVTADMVKEEPAPKPKPPSFNRLGFLDL